jgi:hypothetical protein
MKHIINNFKPTGGSHCITNSLQQIFCFNGYPITEEMLFGIGRGLGFGKNVACHLFYLFYPNLPSVATPKIFFIISYNG